MPKQKAPFSGSQFLAVLFPEMAEKKIAFDWLTSVAPITVWSSGFYIHSPYTKKKAFVTTNPPPGDVYELCKKGGNYPAVQNARKQVIAAYGHVSNAPFLLIKQFAEKLDEVINAVYLLPVANFTINAHSLIAAKMPAGSKVEVTPDSLAKQWWVLIRPPAELPQFQFSRAITFSDLTNVKGAAGVSGTSPTATMTGFVSTAPKTATQTTTVVPLSQATSLGQQVKGTSPGAVYRTIAVGPVNIAARHHGQNLSVRVEPNAKGIAFSSDVKSALSGMGFDHKTGYSSNHYVLNNIPVYRVIGAILSSLDVQFDKRVTTPTEIKNALLG